MNAIHGHSEKLLFNEFYPHHHQPMPTRLSFKAGLAIVEKTSSKWFIIIVCSSRNCDDVLTLFFQLLRLFSFRAGISLFHFLCYQNCKSQLTLPYRALSVFKEHENLTSKWDGKFLKGCNNMKSSNFTYL